MNATSVEAPRTGNSITSINIISVPNGMYVDPDDPTQTRFLTEEQLDARRRQSSPVAPTLNLVANEPASGDDDKPDGE